MSLISAIPGQALNCTLTLPQSAVNPVKWIIKDHTGALILNGQVAPSGTSVVISTTLPSNVSIPLDGSKYSITASDGITSTTEYFTIVAPQDLQVEHGTEVAYLKGSVFKDSLILPSSVSSIAVTIYLDDGTTVVAPQNAINLNVSSPTHYGSNFVYLFDYSQYFPGNANVPVGSLNTNTSSGFGTGTIIWDYLLSDNITESQEAHVFYTVTPYSMQFMNAIRKMVDKARIGDVNTYLQYTMSDLAHALTRGCEYVMQSPPVATGWSLDQIPVYLKDYIVKAGALDILRAQYQAEGMSVFNFQGLRTTLETDRTQYLEQLIGEMESDLQGLPAAKNMWAAQGQPLGPSASLIGAKRPIGVLGLSVGTYSNIPIPALPIFNSAYSFSPYGLGYGPLI